MNDDEKYLFDLNGYLVIEDVLTMEEIDISNQAIDKSSNQQINQSANPSFYYRLE